MTEWTTEQILRQFLIVSQPRAGTQMLERALSAHPDVAMRTWSTSQDSPHPIMGLYGFRPMDRQEARRPFRGTITHSWGDQFTRQAFGMGLDRYWRTVGYFFPRVVILTRVNQLRRFLSYQISDRLDHWSVHDRRPADPEIDFNFDEFMSWLHDTMVYRNAVEKAFPQALRITYEQLVDHWWNTWFELLGFLGIRLLAVQPSTIRQEFRPARKIVANWGADLACNFNHYGMEGWLE